MATKTSLAELQKRIKEAERQLEEDRRLAESMRGDELKAFVEGWLKKAEEQGFSIVEVVEAIRPHFPKARGRKERAPATKKAEPKYRDPKTGQTWTGRGQPAGWLKAYMDAGKKKEDFLIAK